MINIGGNIGELYVGSTKIAEAYVGNQLVYRSGPEVLPYDAEVEYLQSSGTQYINLPMSVAKSKYFEVDIYFRPIYKNNNTYAVMSSNPYAQFGLTFYSYNSSTGKITYASRIGNVSTSGSWNGVVGRENHYILSTEGKTNDAGTYTALSRPLTAAITGFRLFGGYANASRYPIALHKVKITAGTTVLYNLVSVRKDDVGYMYDTISRELFGNNGTGSFTLGNDVT